MYCLKKMGWGTAAIAALLLVAAPGPARAQGAQPPAAPPPRANGTPLGPQGGPQGAPQGFGYQYGTGYLGVYALDVTAAAAQNLKLPEQGGVQIRSVGENTPAAKAGLKTDDVILEYNGQKIENAAQFQRLVRQTPAASQVRMVIWRDGHMENLSAQIAPVPAEGPGSGQFYGVPAPPQGAGVGPNFRFAPGFGPGNGPGGRQQFQGGPFNQAPAVLGISVEDLSAQLGQYFGAPNGEGVLVTEVEPGLAGENAGLKAGDVILKLNNQQVRNAGELRAQVIEHRSDASFTLGVLRRGAETSVTVAPPQPQQGIQPRGGRIPL